MNLMHNMRRSGVALLAAAVTGTLLLAPGASSASADTPPLKVTCPTQAVTGQPTGITATNTSTVFENVSVYVNHSSSAWLVEPAWPETTAKFEWTAPSPGTYTYTVTAVGTNVSYSVDCIMAVISPAPVFDVQSPLLTATAGSRYSYTFAATGAPAPTYALAPGAPPWLAINSATGEVSGVVPRSGVREFTYSVTATNSVGSATAGPFTVRVYRPGFLPQAVLIVKLHCPASITEAGAATCTLTVTNLGPDAAPRTTAVAQISPALTDKSCSGCRSYFGITVWGLSTLAAGASATEAFTVATHNRSFVPCARISVYAQSGAIDPSPWRSRATATIAIIR
jgi:hypothetical protein